MSTEVKAKTMGGCASPLQSCGMVSHAIHCASVQTIMFVLPSDKNQELKFNQPQAPAQINNPKDVLQILSGPIIRTRAQKMKEALIGLVQDILTVETKSKIELKLITFLI